MIEQGLIAHLVNDRHPAMAHRLTDHTLSLFYVYLCLCVPLDIRPANSICVSLPPSFSSVCVCHSVDVARAFLDRVYLRLPSVTSLKINHGKTTANFTHTIRQAVSIDNG